MKYIISTILLIFAITSFGEDVITIDKSAIIQKARAAALVEIEDNPDIDFSFSRLVFVTEPNAEDEIVVSFDGLVNEEIEEDAEQVTTHTTSLTISVNMDQHGNVIEVNPPYPTKLTSTAIKNVQQGGAGYPPQGVGSPDP